MKKKDKPVFEALKSAADALARTFGQAFEVAVHDLDNPNASLIHIAGHLTGRKSGAPITDLVVRELQKNGDAAENIINYRTTAGGGRQLKSSTAFVRNDRGKVIGAFCINFDITDYLNTVSMVQNLITTEEDQPRIRETFAASADETVRALVADAIRHLGRQPARFSLAERQLFVGRLEHSGAFSIKGAVEHVAGIMGVSRHTVYNDLKKIRGRGNGSGPKGRPPKKTAVNRKEKT